MRSSGLVRAVLGLACLLAAGDLAPAGSGTPPEGPPWLRDFREARSRAIREGRPLFVYVTTDHRVQCVEMEQGVLRRPELRPLYDRMVWLHLYSSEEPGRSSPDAEPVCVRLGLTRAFPYHLILDPLTLQIRANTGRTIESFLAAAGGIEVLPGDPEPPAEALRAADERAEALVRSRSVESAALALDDPDPLVRFRALRILSAKDPLTVVKRAAQLLSTHNDVIRIEAIRSLGRTGDRAPARLLEDLVRDPVGARNRDLVRIAAIEALGCCGDGGSLPLLLPIASSRDFMAWLTPAAVNAAAGIALRLPRCEFVVVEALRAAFPPVGESLTESGMSMRLAYQVNAALCRVTEIRVPWPTEWNEETRRALLRAWGAE